MDRCEQCGFAYDLERAPASGPAIVHDADQLARILTDVGEASRTRWEPDTWSILEYGCHVRDVLLVQRERVLVARRRDRPWCEPMGRDERVAHDGYSEQHPADVAGQINHAASLFANVLSRLEAPDWERSMMYTYPEQLERSLRWVAVHTQHDVHHHLLDVRGHLE